MQSDPTDLKLPANVLVNLNVSAYSLSQLFCHYPRVLELACPAIVEDGAIAGGFQVVYPYRS